tara:strand:+ start:2402 stop:2629 length:228 start_codon:yes stop_codon:yes gene_type:complete
LTTQTVLTTQMITVRAPIDLHERLKAEAKRRGCSLNTLCVELLAIDPQECLDTFDCNAGDHADCFPAGAPKQDTD